MKRKCYLESLIEWKANEKPNRLSLSADDFTRGTSVSKLKPEPNASIKHIKDSWNNGAITRDKVISHAPRMTNSLKLTEI